MFNSDSIAEEDKLDRIPFASQLSYNLVHSFKNGNPSLAIGLEGKWGSGKSTLIGFIKKHIKEEHEKKQDKNYIIFDFNPWMFSGQKELQTIFLNQLAKKIASINQNLREFFEKFSEAINVFSFVKYVHPTAEKVFEGAKSLTKELAKQESIEKLKDEVDLEIKKSSFRLYIFIDDIDRLPPDEIAEILQLVKLNASFINTFYILAYDKRYVTEALKKKYGGGGESYLEKIIQVDYAVPEIKREKIESIFFEKLREFIGEHNLPITEAEIFSIWKNHRFKNVFNNLRDVYRYFNALKLRLPAIFKEINTVDFMLLESLRLFDYGTYTKLIEQVTAKQHHLIIDRQPFFENLDKSSPSFGISSYLIRDAEKYHITYKTDKRFIDPMFTDRYISLSISSIDVPEIELERFMTVRNERQSILSSISEFGRTENFLRRLANPLLKKHFNRLDEEIFQTFLNFWDEPERHQELEKYWLHIQNAVFNLLSVGENPVKTFDLLVRDLVPYQRSSLTRLMILDYILFHFGQDISYDILNIIKPLVEEKKEEFTEAFKKNLENDITGFLQRPSISYLGKYRLLRDHVTLKFAQHFPEKYLELLNLLITTKHLNDYKDLIIIMKTSIYISTTTQKPHSLKEHTDNLIPKFIRHNFVNRIKKINPELLDEEDKLSRDFFLNNIQL